MKTLILTVLLVVLALPALAQYRDYQGIVPQRRVVCVDYSNGTVCYEAWVDTSPLYNWDGSPKNHRELQRGTLARERRRWSR